MSDIRARIVSSHSSTESTDDLLISVESRSGDALPSTGWTVSLSPSDKEPTGIWAAAAFTVGAVPSKGTVTLAIGPESGVGELAARPWWPFVQAGDEIEPAGVFVLRGVTPAPTVPTGLSFDIDGVPYFDPTGDGQLLADSDDTPYVEA